eukprot:TRINITY_DN119935_c0_g1_i2.p1 TRINITY_DN119935_c0_g1~~TRINITY_DN119935_c0_g1_i2.p1  ORF type:complete len:103 (+),score=2.93 TRINITY_DN119935_c0_g1_i2:39-347(+)
MGTCTVGYKPLKRKVLGLSKVVRIVQMFSQRLQMQERLGEQIAAAVRTTSESAWVVVSIKASHCCMEMRGVSKPGCKTVSMSTDGAVSVEDRAAFMSLLGGA